ncbi:MAG TPA: hypothetical protein VJL81_13275 [Solirubrobacterales bacterium]|nr:hypothetical protein [Solirubrobacterales bacterium]
MSTDEAELTRTRTLEWSDPVATAAAGAEMAGLDYLRAVIAGELGRPPISGRRQATAEARLTAEESGKLLATGTSTLMIFGG